MRRLFVAMVCPQFRPILGGYERAAERLSEALARRGHRVLVLTERRDRRWPAREQLGPVEVRRLPCLPRRGLHVATASSALAARLLRDPRPDVVHVHQYGASAATAIACSKLRGIPVVLKVTNTGPHGLGAVVARQRLAGLQRALHLRADAFVATSRRAAEELRALGIAPDRVVGIPNGVDCEVFRPAGDEERRALRRQLGLGPGPVVLFLGRLVPQKAPELLLEAVGRLAGGLPPELRPQLAFVGDGPARDALRAAAASLSGGTALFPGEVADPTPWLRAADLFALPSHFEGLSNALLEALACGLPVVASRVSGTEDVFAAGRVGRLFEPGDAAGLARALRELLADPGARAVAAHEARRVAEKVFSLDTVAERTLALYETLVAGRKAGEGAPA